MHSITAIGDAPAPDKNAAAMWGGRRYAEEFDTTPDPNALSFRREAAARPLFDLHAVLAR